MSESSDVFFFALPMTRVLAKDVDLLDPFPDVVFKLYEEAEVPGRDVPVRDGNDEILYLRAALLAAVTVGRASTSL